MTIAQLHEINRRSYTMPEPKAMSIRYLLMVLQGRGISLSHAEAVDWLKTLAAADRIGAEQQTTP